jgi:hypothetical protein
VTKGKVGLSPPAASLHQGTTRKISKNRKTALLTEPYILCMMEIFVFVFSKSDQQEIKRRLNSGNAFYRSVQNLLCSRLLSKNTKIRIYKTLILPVIMYGCELGL